MVKPQSLWALFKTCENSQWLGDVCRALGGQNVALDKGQLYMLQSLKLDNEWHNEAIEEQQRRERERKAEYRRKRETQGDTPAPAPKTPATSATAEKPAPAPVAIPRRTGETVNADLSKVDISEDNFFSGNSDAVLMARKITCDMGKAAGVYWRNWIKADAANGESQFLEILFAFKREIEAGEDVENRGAAFTQRLKDWRKHNPAKQKPDNPAERLK